LSIKNCLSEERPDLFADNAEVQYRESRRCSRDTYPEAYITKYTSIRRQRPDLLADNAEVLFEDVRDVVVEHPPASGPSLQGFFFLYYSQAES